MRRRILLLGLIGAVPLLAAPQSVAPSPAAATSAWLDLRQNAKPGAVQTAPPWVEEITLIPGEQRPKTDAVTLITAATTPPTVFRMRVKKPDDAYSVLFLRVFFNDRPDARPSVAMWDASRQQMLRFGPFGIGIDLESSDSCMIPIEGERNIDVEVPGDGSNLRTVYMQWMTTSELVHAVGTTTETAVPQPFAQTVPLHAPASDNEQFGTVTATLSADPIRIGATPEEAAVFQFGIEAQPLLALVTFEVASPRIGAPPDVVVNGQDVGPASITLPDLADPAYRGEMRALMHEMQFTYTGWVRAQKLVPVSALQTGTNRISILNPTEAGSSAVRATQIQLKYLWDKSDYILQPAR
jgi:hypothetical protein